MAASSNYTKKREKPTYNHIGGSSRPQPVPPKQPSLEPALTSFSPVNMVYWGYWKSHDETLQVVTPTGTTDAVGVTGTNPAAVQNVTPTVATTVTTTVDRVVNVGQTSPLNQTKPPTSQSGEKVPPKSEGSSVYKVPPVDTKNPKGQMSTKDKKTATPSDSSSAPKGAGFTDQEIIQGVSGIVKAFKDTGWADKSIIAYFLTPSSLGYRQFPGITTELFVKAADGIIDVSSLVSGNKGGAGTSSGGSSSGGFNTRGIV